MPSSDPIAAVPDQATIVIVQPRLHLDPVTFVDARGEILGQLSDTSHTVLQVPPGPVRIYAIGVPGAPTWSGRIDGTVLAGRTYFATIGMSRRGWGGMNFFALNPRSRDDRWAHREQFLTSTPRVQLDPAQIPEIQATLGDLAATMASVDEAFDRLDDGVREQHTIRPEDGL